MSRLCSIGECATAQGLIKYSRMTPEERDEMNRICKLIQEEKDHQRFSLLIAKLIEVIGRKERRLEEQDRNKT
jgi:hypothetical protein